MTVRKSHTALLSLSTARLESVAPAASYQQPRHSHTLSLRLALCLILWHCHPPGSRESGRDRGRGIWTKGGEERKGYVCEAQYWYFKVQENTVSVLYGTSKKNAHKDMG